METKARARKILPYNWRPEVDILKVDSIDNDIILLDKPLIMSAIDYPFKVDVTCAIICITGRTEGYINLNHYVTEGPYFITILSGQIMQYKSISDDFTGLFIVMSQKFTDSLMPLATDRLPLSLSVRDNPAIPLNEEALEGMINYFEMIKKVIHVKDHPFRIEVVRHLTLAFFYGVGVDFHKIDDTRKKTQSEVFFEKFLNLVQTHFKSERGLDFYADKLCVTSKHLSKVIKATTEKPANDWIDEYVALEAKALIKSTNMTVEQISEALNFPSQSFFGKYFKRVTGVSPRDYKEKG
jgi:AraC-like DNA-binding protein